MGKRRPGEADERASLRLPGRKQPIKPTDLPLVDRLSGLAPPTLPDYLRGVSEYVRQSPALSQETKKAAQIRLSFALAQVLVAELKTRLPGLDARAGEHTVAGALRTVQADVSEYHALDGLRLAVEIKPVNLAVGRALWNRFGDIRAFAVNLHLKFPFAVVGGVLVIPTYEVTKDGSPKSTLPLIARTVSRLVRAGRRRNESDAPHLLEGIAVIIYDPQSGTLNEDIPPAQGGLRWSEFVHHIVEAYDTRFGEGMETPMGEPGPPEDSAAEDHPGG